MQRHFSLWQLKWWMRSRCIMQGERRAVFICPEDSACRTVIRIFVDMVNEQNISLKDVVWFINMDEYLDDEKQWVSKDHPLSFRRKDLCSVRFMIKFARNW